MVTATRDRRSDDHAETDELDEWGQRSLFGAAKGWPWWAAVLFALALSIIGGFIDMKTSGDLSKIFEGGYFLGCVGAVCLVRRRNVFGPMVQAPLVLAVTVPTVVLLTKGLPPSGGNASKLIALGIPLVTGFPTMAITTGATVVIGVIRYLVQRKPAVDGDWGDDSGSRRRSTDRDADRGDRDRPTSSARRSGGSTSSGSSRDSSGRSSRDDRDDASDRGRSSQSGRSRSEAPSREGRSSSSRSASGRTSQDRDRDRDSRSSRDRGQGSDRGRSSSRSSGQSRDRGSQPRGRSSRDDDDRRQSPPRRRDDDY